MWLLGGFELDGHDSINNSVTDKWQMCVRWQILKEQNTNLAKAIFYGRF